MVFSLQKATSCDSEYAETSFTTYLTITFQALLILPLISSLALLMSSPIFLHTHLHVPLIEQQQQTQQFDASAAGTTTINEESGDYDSPPPTAAPVDYWSHLVFCIEDWNYGGE